jgi:aspartate kinase
MFNCLAEGQVNIKHISTSEIVVSCIVDSADGERALQLLHAAFELDKS